MTTRSHFEAGRKGYARRQALATARLLVAGALAAGFAGLQSGCGNAAEHPGPTPHHSVAAVGTEPPRHQSPPSDPSFAHEVVARVATHRITRAYLERWTSLQVILSSKYRLGPSVPTGYVPDPPSYRSCVAYLRGTGGSVRGVGQSSSEALKTQCQREHRMQGESTLGLLLRYAWIYEEAAKRGVTVSTAEIRSEIAKTGVKAAVLNAFGILPSDQHFVVGAELLTRKLFQTLSAYRRLLRKGGEESMTEADEIDNERTKFYASIEKRWTARTRCEPEFVVPGCSEYSPENIP